MSSRRDFLRTTAVAGGALLGAGPLLACASTLARSAAAPPARKLDLLVLGGTGFIGPHLVRHAVARGHRVTIFTRGRRDADLPPEVVRLTGDRNGKLEALEGKRWDAVIDDSATNPEWVRLSTALLRGNVGRYLFTSSTGVYYPYLSRGLDESAPVRLDADDPKDGSATFGVAKARCERVTRDAFGDRAIVVRPTYIVGPGDTTDRFPYWPVRLAKGGEVLAPGRRDDPVQFIDVRDLAEFMVKLVEDGRGGIYNAVGPVSTLTMRSFLEQSRDALGALVRLAASPGGLPFPVLGRLAPVAFPDFLPCSGGHAPTGMQTGCRCEDSPADGRWTAGQRAVPPRQPARACQSARACASWSGAIAKRGAARRFSGTDGHQARVSRTESARGR